MCGELYCCGAAEMSSVFEESGECCTLCSDTGACVAQAECQLSPPPLTVPQPPPPPLQNYSSDSSNSSGSNNMRCTTEKLTAGQNCYDPANGNDHLCASGRCGYDYCCDEFKMQSAFEQIGECCVECSLTGACLATSPAMCASNSCDASAAPTDGDVGNCTAALFPSSTCAATCGDGFQLIGKRTCNAHIYVNTASCVATCEDRYALLEQQTCDSTMGEYNVTATCVPASELPPPSSSPPSLTPSPPPISNETGAIVADAAD